MDANPQVNMLKIATAQSDVKHMSFDALCATAKVSKNVRETLSKTDHVRKLRLYGFATPCVSVYFRTKMHSTLH